MSFSPNGGAISGADDVALSNPSTKQVLAFNATLAKWQNETLPSASESFTYAGTLVVGSGVLPLYNDSGIARTILSVRASVATAPTGSSILVDVNVEGSTIFPTQSQRPTIAASGLTSGAIARSVAWPSGQSLRIDIDQVGSTVAGSNLIITIEYR